MDKATSRKHLTHFLINLINPLFTVFIRIRFPLSSCLLLHLVLLRFRTKILAMETFPNRTRRGSLRNCELSWLYADNVSFYRVRELSRSFFFSFRESSSLRAAMCSARSFVLMRPSQTQKLIDVSLRRQPSSFKISCRKSRRWYAYISGLIAELKCVSTMP